MLSLSQWETSSASPISVADRQTLRFICYAMSPNIVIVYDISIVIVYDDEKKKYINLITIQMIIIVSFISDVIKGNGYYHWLKFRKILMRKLHNKKKCLYKIKHYLSTVQPKNILLIC